MKKKNICISGAKENNLQNIDVSIPRDKFVIITGISGSGKSSLAFNTIYAEGQRRYVESLSSYARQFIGIMEKPDVESIEGLSPAISIEQKAVSQNPRSTVGTTTEIYDYLRLLFARVGDVKCVKCQQLVQKQNPNQITKTILKLEIGTKVIVLAPTVRQKKGTFKELLTSIKKEGFVRARIDGKIIDITKTPILDKNKNHNIEIIVDRLIIKENLFDRLIQSVELALKIGNGTLVIHANKKDVFFSETFCCPDCNLSFAEPEPKVFSFNSPLGACTACDGLGTTMLIDVELVIPDTTKSLLQGCIAPLGPQPRGRWHSSVLKRLSSKYDFSFKTPWRNLSAEVQNLLLFGKEKLLSVNYKSSTFSGHRKRKFEGYIPNLQRRYHNTHSSFIKSWIEKYMTIQNCKICKGARLNNNGLSVFINDYNINDLCNKTISELYYFLQDIHLSASKTTISNEILKEINNRLQFLISVGLDYLTLHRLSKTLSGGEMQRIRLATQIGSQLVGVLYILDEPSIGLHPRDNKKLIDTLIQLRDLGNTVLVVEHDEQIMRLSDWIIDLGPGAGVNGGKIVAQGTPKQIIKDVNSITGHYLSGQKYIKIPSSRRRGNGKYIIINGAKGHNLKNIGVSFPLGQLICVTGVSGSGKSTLINHTLLPALSRKLNYNSNKPLSFINLKGAAFLDKIININQSPIGRTPRSNPATYTGLFSYIRELYSKLPDAKVMGYKPGRFSFNVKGGRCEHCKGVGLIKIEMHFLSDIYIECDECSGQRFNEQTLLIKYNQHNIFQILNMTVDEARIFFKDHKSITRKLGILCKVGLGYIRLGQQATTLSGGESQRIKLATELSKINTGRTLYLLDEPTTGLHFQDIEMLLKVLNNLVDKGNTVIVIEHNLDVIKSADWIIDLGPDGGIRGGEIVCKGTPEQVSKVKKSYTGQFLKNILR